MDHISVPAVVRTREGVDTLFLELGIAGGWVTIEPAEVGGPALTIDECSMQRLFAAWNLLTEAAVRSR